MSDAGDPCGLCGGLTAHLKGCYHSLPDSDCKVCGGITHSSCSGKQELKPDWKPDRFDYLALEVKKIVLRWEEGVINRIELLAMLKLTIDSAWEKRDG
jgi:hypothetical protein